MFTLKKYHFAYNLFKYVGNIPCDEINSLFILYTLNTSKQMKQTFTRIKRNKCIVMFLIETSIIQL